MGGIIEKGAGPVEARLEELGDHEAVAGVMESGAVGRRPDQG